MFWNVLTKSVFPCLYFVQFSFEIFLFMYAFAWFYKRNAKIKFICFGRIEKEYLCGKILFLVVNVFSHQLSFKGFSYKETKGFSGCM